jgi:hypothetical protein
MPGEARKMARVQRVRQKNFSTKKSTPSKKSRKAKKEQKKNLLEYP